MRHLFPVCVGLLLGAAVPARAADTTSPGTEPTAASKIGGKTLEQWIHDLGSHDPSIAEVALQTIPLYGPAASKAVPSLVPLLSSADASLRVYSAIALSMVPIKDASELPGVVDGLVRRLRDDQQSIVRYHAALALAQYGPGAKAAIPQLLNTIQDRGSWEIRKVAVYALGRSAAGQGGPDMNAVNGLLQVLRIDSCAQVRREAAVALVAMWPSGSVPVQQVRQVAAGLAQQLAVERDQSVVVCMHLAAARIGDPVEPHLQAVAKLLKTGKESARTQAAAVLGDFGAKAKGQVPDLILALKDEDPQVVATSCWALGQIGSAAANAVPFLTDLIEKQKDEGVRQAAKDALEKIKGKSNK